MQVLDGMLENRHEFGQTEVRDFMHLGVDEDLEGSDGEGDVRSRSRNRQRVVKCLPAEVRSVDRLHQIAAGH